jgi:hypothetical protein
LSFSILKAVGFTGETEDPGSERGAVKTTVLLWGMT